MKKKRIKSYEDEDWYSNIMGTGSYQRIGPPNNKTKMKQIGFIRQKTKKKKK